MPDPRREHDPAPDRGRERRRHRPDVPDGTWSPPLLLPPAVRSHGVRTSPLDTGDRLGCKSGPARPHRRRTTRRSSVPLVPDLSIQQTDAVLAAGRPRGLGLSALPPTRISQLPGTPDRPGEAARAGIPAAQATPDPAGDAAAVRPTARQGRRDAGRGRRSCRLRSASISVAVKAQDRLTGGWWGRVRFAWVEDHAASLGSRQLARNSATRSTASLVTRSAGSGWSARKLIVPFHVR